MIQKVILNFTWRPVLEKKNCEQSGKINNWLFCGKMFKNAFQSGFLSILYSIGSKPLQIWDKKVRNGHIKRITDNDIQSLVLEIEGTNVSTTYITCPEGKSSF